MRADNAQAALPLHTVYSPTLRRIPAVVLIACCKRKAAEPRPARELYRGDLFRASVAYAEAAGLPWAVLSAAHRIVLPGQIVAPYDTTLADLRETARVVWARLSVIELFGKIGHPARCIILAGAKYREHVETELRSRGVLEVESPLAGLAIGLQKQRLAAMTAAAIGAAA